MKTSFKTLVSALALSLLAIINVNAQQQTSAQPENDFAVSMYQTINTMNMNLFVAKQANHRATVVLKNEKGNVIYSDIVSKGAKLYHGKFDLSDLQDGKYHFEITEGDKTIVKNVSIGTKQPEPTSSDRFISMN